MPNRDWPLVAALGFVAFGLGLNIAAQAPSSFLGQTFDQPINFFTAILAVFTIALAGSGLWQVRLTRRSIDEAKQSSERQLRAYVYVTTRLPAMKGGKLFVEFLLRNSGQTPAYNVRTLCDGWIDDYPDGLKTPDLSGEDAAPHCINPGAELSVFVELEFTDDDLEAIRAETKAVRGAINLGYEDVFGRSWYSKTEAYTAGRRNFDDPDESMTRPEV